MKAKVLATILLVVVALPVATAHAPSPDGADASNAKTDSFALETTSSDDSASTTSSDDSASNTSSDENPEEYTKLFIDTDREHPQLKPGETGTFEITVKNGEDETVTVNPHLYVPPVGGDQDRIEKSWISIEGDTTIASGEEQTYTVTVTVPADAKTGYYGGRIAFTDQTVTYPGRPASPVHAAGINVEVWRKPTVTIVSGEYLRGQIKAGDSVTRQIVVKNTGEQAVPVNPQLKSQRNHYGSSSTWVDPSWMDIDAPNSIAPGETATVTVTVSPPESVENGRYRGELDLGLKDPARREQQRYWQEISMNFEVWSQPDEPFHTSFEVSEETENVSLTLSPRSIYSMSSSDKAVSFDVAFVSPSGDRIEADRVRLSDRGFVDLSDQSHGNAVETQGEYSLRGVSKEFVYRVDDPEAGQWTVEIMPENTIGFNYRVVRNEALDSIEATDSTASTETTETTETTNSTA